MTYLFRWLGIRVKIVYVPKVNILGIQEELGLGRKKVSSVCVKTVGLSLNILYKETFLL